jgi:hypothetical protein
VASRVSIAASYELEGRGSISCRDFSLLHSVQTGSGTHSLSYPMSTGALSSEMKQPGRESDYSRPSSAETINGGAIPPFPDTSVCRDTQLIKHGDNFAFTLLIL